MLVMMVMTTDNSDHNMVSINVGNAKQLIKIPEEKNSPQSASETVHHRQHMLSLLEHHC